MIQCRSYFLEIHDGRTWLCSITYWALVSSLNGSGQKLLSCVPCSAYTEVLCPSQFLPFRSIRRKNSTFYKNLITYCRWNSCSLMSYIQCKIHSCRTRHRQGKMNTHRRLAVAIVKYCIWCHIKQKQITLPYHTGTWFLNKNLLTPWILY